MDQPSAATTSRFPPAALVPYPTSSDPTRSAPKDPVLDQIADPARPPPVCLAGRQMYSREQWDVQKQVIWCLYTEENKPFKRVIEILRTEHNFFPTRRQFYRKISEWGFEKNIKEKEKKAIAENLEKGHMEGPVELRGRQIDIAKIHRWRKRQGRMTGPANISQAQPEISQFKDVEMIDNNTLALTNAGNSAVFPSERVSTYTTAAMETSRALDIWATIDVPGSPLLSRLFEALRIECPVEITPMSIGSPIEASTEPYLAVAEMREAHSTQWASETVSREFEGPESQSPGSSVVVRREDLGLRHAEWHPPDASFDEWSLSQWDFSRGCPLVIERNMGPPRPLFPFPTSSTECFRKSLGCRVQAPFGRWESLKVEEITRKNNLNVLSEMLSKDDPQVIQAKLDLAYTYQRLGMPQQTEPLLRQAARSLESTLGFKHRKTLDAYLDDLHFLGTQGKWMDASKIHPSVHAAIETLAGPYDMLTLDSTLIMSAIKFSLGKKEDAERLDRQILQKLLGTLGPRHRITLRAMRRVARCLCRSMMLDESENLLSIILQLQLEENSIEDVENFDGNIEIELARVLRCQRRYRESKALLLTAAQRSRISHGPGSPKTLRLLTHAAKCMGKLGQIDECQSLLQTILKRQLKVLGESHANTIDTRFCLAEILEIRGRSFDAVAHYEISLKGSTENFGLESTEAIMRCRCLGKCYQNLGRCKDAFNLYQGTIDQLKKIHGENHPDIVRVRRWVAKLADLWPAGQGVICDRNGEMVLDEDLINACLSADREVGGDCEAIDKGHSVADDSWMKDFVSFQTPKDEGTEGS